MSKRIRVKPGKTQSKMGFITGLIFCCIGLFFVIPSCGAFGIVWTLLAVVITVTNALNAFTEKGVPSHEIVLDDSDNTESASNEDSIEERMEKLKEMYEKELITSDEYEAKKKDLLDKL